MRIRRTKAAASLRSATALQDADATSSAAGGRGRPRTLAKEREVLNASQEPGGIFGPISLFDGRPRVKAVFGPTGDSLRCGDGDLPPANPGGC
jgi:hypothetical protein